MPDTPGIALELRRCAQLSGCDAYHCFIIDLKGILKRVIIKLIAASASQPHTGIKLKWQHLM
jgi:hypothetical protein